MTQRKPTGKTYTFKTVQDMTEQLNDDQIDAFTTDLRTWLHMTKGNYSGSTVIKAVVGLAKALGKLQGLPEDKIIRQDASRFVWTDDGGHGVKKINIIPVKSL